MHSNKVLIIDDDSEILEELQEFLVLGGYDVEVLSDSAQALEWVERIKPNVVLLDIKMSPKTGFEIADDLRYLHYRSNMVVIAMSGYVSAQDQAFLMKQCGIEAFLPKPFPPISLIAKMDQMLVAKERKLGHEPWDVWGSEN